MKYAQSNFIADFTKFFPMNYEKYERKKLESLEKMKKDVSKQSKYLLQRNRIIKYCYSVLKISINNLEDASGMKARTIYDIIEEKQLN